MRRLLLVACLLAPAAALADPVLECGLKASSQVEIGDCLTATETAVDATIAEALGFAMDSAKALDAETGRAAAVPGLEAAQSAWASYREAHCAYVGATYGGGSGTGAAIHACRISLGRARVEALMRQSG